MSRFHESLIMPGYGSHYPLNFAPRLLLTLALWVGAAGIASTPPMVPAITLWYVAPGGSDSADCLSPTTACATINGAIGKATDGDTIRVASGVYGEQVTYKPSNSSASLTFSGGWNAAFTQQSGVSIIDGQGAHRGILNYAIATFDRFVIQNGIVSELSHGGGIGNLGTMTLNNSAVLSNTYGAIHNTSVMTVNNSLISANIAYGGSIIFNEGGTLSLNNTSVSGNRGPVLYNAEFYSRHGTLILNNSTVSDNTGTAIIGNRNSTVTLNSSTITGNGGGIVNWDREAVIILRNTIAQGCEGIIHSLGHNLIESTSSCAFAPEAGDLTNVDPKLGGLLGSPGYRPLLPSSPAVDAGNPVGCQGSMGLLTTDQRGASRWGICDIGAYEYTPPGPPASILTLGGTPQHTLPFSARFEAPFQAIVIDSLGTPVSYALVTFAAPASGPSGTFVNSRTFTATAVADEGGIATAAMFMANNLTGTYSVTATVTGVLTPADFVLGNHILWYVSPTGSDVNDCSSVNAACATVAGVLGKDGFLGDAVLVAEGTYSNTVLSRDVYLSGGWNSGFTQQMGVSVIDDPRWRGITVGVDGDVRATIERFTLQNGRVALGGGAGIYIAQGSTLTLINSNVISNVAYLANSFPPAPAAVGGGILNAGTLILNSSTIANNQASDGAGGIFNSGTLILNNSTISGNRATNGNAGGILNAGTAVLRNVTISGNWAPGEGGGIDTWGGLLYLQNTILAGNLAGGEAQDCKGRLSPLGYYLLIQNTAGCLIGPQQIYPPAPPNSLVPGTVITGVQALLGSLQNNGGPTLTQALLPGSPAIDAGDPATPGSGGSACEATDQRGITRPQRARCDIGAYEYDASLYRLFLSLILNERDASHD